MKTFPVHTVTVDGICEFTSLDRDASWKKFNKLARKAYDGNRADVKLLVNGILTAETRF